MENSIKEIVNFVRPLQWIQTLVKIGEECYISMRETEK